MRWSSLPLLLGLLGSQTAQAGACCTGATSIVPIRLGECERWLMGVGAQAETTTGTWQSDGTVGQTSMTDDAVITTLAGAWRWDRKGQTFATLPLRLNHRSASGIDEVAGGVGDLRAGLTWDPIEERADSWMPVPVITLGTRLPTGRDWRSSEATLQTDVTGLVGPAVIGAMTAERTLGRTPWSLGVDLESGGGLTAAGATGALGRYLGPRWSLSGTLRHIRTYTNSSTTARTNAGLRLTRGQMLRWRGWVGVDGDVPLSGLGSAAIRQAHVSIGVAVVR